MGNNKALNGIDGNKKIKSIKRHVALDKNGFLIDVLVTVANMHNSKTTTLQIQVLKNQCSCLKVIIADSGYRGRLAQKALGNHLDTYCRSS